MASNMLDVDPTTARFEDIDQRRKIIQSQYKAIDWTNEELTRTLHQSAVDEVCNVLHTLMEGVLKVGHVYFEYMVDKIIWLSITKRRAVLGLPVIEWPWTRGPRYDDESMGISATYHEWRERNGLEVPKDRTHLPLSVLPSKQASQSVPDQSQDQSRVLARVADNIASAIAKSHASDKDFAEQMAAKLALKEKMKQEEETAFIFALRNKTHAARLIFDEEVATIRAGAAKPGKRTMSLAEESEAVLLPSPVILPIRLSSRLDLDQPVKEAKVPTLDHRIQLWQKIMGQGIYQAPCIGPFEVAIPQWLNFHGLVWGHRGVLYAQLASSLPQFLTVSWIISGEKPVSLVVGFKLGHEGTSKVHRSWQDLMMLWDDVVPWVREVNLGTCTPLVESLTLSHWRRMFKVRHCQHPSLANNHLASSANLGTSEAEALKRYHEEEVWTPQLYAILNQQPISSIEEGLRAWVCREVGDRRRRAMLASKVWVVVAARNESTTIQVFRALEWEYRALSSLTPEVNAAASR